ncbi:branched-chain amino acid transport system substrate-binding protein [Lutimaribacter pacificus]|uniref:Amino acid/amide ABC transporter substrate-binding protein, HAAT family n=1 Tax=Lutimaribacter pacificus TaxID=391948 RepID=A0A1H0M8J4_9RHOB|nr:ABC transporter substrate-binding protein [Lutimaribacter pacificus]SDO76789.1 branched-chain amino acid transport system substrate-binding protein [Lutimaribacter pacificus]SHK79106.1 amino acid/amide ABC transporter substrate-binding protein, HAAT family [Lutimaribacter pacificus]
MFKTTRRTMMGLMAGAASLAIGVGAARAQDGDIVIGGSLPMTGVFGFAGVAVEAGMQDYIKIVNDQGGIGGRNLRLAYEDTAYKVDQSVAVFNKLTSQDEIHLYYGDSTGFAKTIAPELARSGEMIMGGASFASELNDPEAYPYIFMAGPDYSEMFGILLEYIAQETPGARLVLVNSDTEFGRDPIESTRAKAAELGLEIVEEIITAPGSVDVSTEVLKLRRARPDYTLFHGYVLSPLPEFMSQAKQLGLETKFMGTFWSMDSSLWEGVGEAADGFMGVMPYRYYYDDAENAPMMETIREMRPDYQATGYMQGFLSAMLMAESARRVLDNGEELNGKTLKAAMNTIEDFDTGGIMGVPISVPGNSVPVGRVYQFDASAGRMVAVSDWISLDKE